MRSVRDMRAAAAGLTGLACLGWAVVYAADLADSTVWGGMGLLLGDVATFLLFALALGSLHSYEHLRPATIGLCVAAGVALGAWVLSFLHGFQLCGVGMMCDSGPFPGQDVWDADVVRVGWIGLAAAFAWAGFYGRVRGLRREGPVRG